ncbi:hypothetical protein GT755_16345 [Herbidospora sp. NEAU-GS84]|uniref:Ferritin-like domain-containing protein n=1 Tax=Herbidospora solisilvae TaxID=2696284 RepID=A0A7C9J430_9ACTN|nr:hypothetical protein [Herbidospora solisilvae]NAS23260.1 hypothetical protein [Herbidospora solisilvae]
MNLSRRALLGAGAGLVLVGCAKGQEAASPVASPSPDPHAALLAGLIGGKEKLVALYQQAALSDAKLAPALQPFQQRHLAHLAALRKHLPEPGSPAATPTPVVNPEVTVEALKEAERAAAAARPEQAAAAKPVVAQLVASMGACEAVHAQALGRLK